MKYLVRRAKETRKTAMVAAAFVATAVASPVVVSDVMRGPELKDVRLEGWLGQKMD